MGSITNLYHKPLVLTQPPQVPFGFYGKVIVGVGKSLQWEGPDCFISCDNPDDYEDPEAYQNLGKEWQEQIYLPGEWLWHGVQYMIHAGVE